MSPAARQTHAGRIKNVAAKKNEARRGLSKILITAGPTRERIDRVRYISNFSTGSMGYELARASRKKGYDVTLISGPTNFIPPKGIEFVSVEDTGEMERAVKRHFGKSDCLFMASAVCDWRPQIKREGKLKTGKKHMALHLVRNTDILGGIGREKDGKILAGFALEAKSILRSAKAKLKKKNLDLIVANRVGGRTPFGTGNTDVIIIDKYGRAERMANVPKKKVAERLLEKAELLWAEKA